MARTYHVHKVAISDDIYASLEKKRRVEKPHFKMTQYVQDVLFRFGRGEISDIQSQQSQGKRVLTQALVAPSSALPEEISRKLKKAG